LEAARTAQADTATRAQDLATRLAVAEAAVPPEPQDLTRIEGIGPAISRVLSEAGIVNYAQLAEAAVDRLRDILAAAGPRFRIARPTTWPQQARLAAEAKWDELQELQDSLTAGRAANPPGSGEPQEA
jgi:predicted flap endonuclease-1-like 5' DNA nuclease